MLDGLKSVCFQDRKRRIFRELDFETERIKFSFIRNLLAYNIDNTMLLQLHKNRGSLQLNSSCSISSGLRTNLFIRLLKARVHFVFNNAELLD